MQVEAQDIEDSPVEHPKKSSTHSVLRVRADLHEEYSADDIAKMT